MKKLSCALFAALSAASFPALAGPNWEVIHQERIDSASDFRPAEAAPLDHGPRPQTTQWLNEKLGAHDANGKHLLSANRGSSARSRPHITGNYHDVTS